MAVESSLKILQQLRTTRRPPVLIFAATFLWTRQNSASLNDLKTTLGVDATLDTIDAELRVAAEEHYDELLQWCIRTASRLDGTTVRNPKVWLSDTMRALDSLRGAGNNQALLTQISTIDELLEAAAPEDLLEARGNISEYIELRRTILRDIADTN